MEHFRRRVFGEVGGLIDAQLSLSKGLSFVYRVTVGERGGRSDPERDLQTNYTTQSKPFAAAGKPAQSVVGPDGGLLELISLSLAERQSQTFETFSSNHALNNALGIAETLTPQGRRELFQDPRYFPVFFAWRLP